MKGFSFDQDRVFVNEGFHEYEFSITCIRASGTYCHRLRTHRFACPARMSEV